MTTCHTGMAVRRRRLVLGAMLALCMARGAVATTIWVDPPPARPEAGRSVRLRIGSGHRFPESRGAPRRSSTLNATVRRPDGTLEHMELVADATVHTATLEIRQPGLYMVSAELRGSRNPEVSFATTFIEANGRGGPGEAYRSNRGLEIAPVQPVSSLTPGERLSFIVLDEGRPVTADIRVLPPNRRAFSVPSRAAPTPISFMQPGSYLMTTFHEGREATLTLRADAHEPSR